MGFDLTALMLFKNLCPYMIDYGVTSAGGSRILDTANIAPTFAESFQPDSTQKLWTLKLRRGTWLGAVGLPQPRPLAALAETAAVVARLLRGDRSAHAGQVFSLAADTVLRYPVQRPSVPLLLGAWGPQGAALAGRIADEIKVGGSANRTWCR